MLAYFFRCNNTGSLLDGKAPLIIINMSDDSIDQSWTCLTGIVSVLTKLAALIVETKSVRHSLVSFWSTIKTINNNQGIYKNRKPLAAYSADWKWQRNIPKTRRLHCQSLHQCAKRNGWPTFRLETSLAWRSSKSLQWMEPLLEDQKDQKIKREQLSGNWLIV